MPYVDQTWTHAEARRHCLAQGLLGANMPDIADQVVKLELVCSSFSDPGSDWCEFRAYNGGGKMIRARRIEGY